MMNDLQAIALHGLTVLLLYQIALLLQRFARKRSSHKRLLGQKSKTVSEKTSIYIKDKRARESVASVAIGCKNV